MPNMIYPIATYRMQFNQDFDFYQGIKEVGYLKKLGISHLYASPCLKAVKGSRHGYDGVDFAHVNPELGGAKGYEKLCAALKQQEMGQILDIVPNHMAAHSRENLMWRDVLTFGELSPYEEFFDINRQARDEKIYKKVLVPILGDHYDTCLKSGQLILKRNHSEISLVYFDHDLPLSPEAIQAIIKTAQEKFSLPADLTKESDFEAYAEPIDKTLNAINANPDHVHDLLELCWYRLAYWRTAFSDINYRRFFDINELVGLCMEKEQVFRAYHRQILKWIESGNLEGLRIDHPDGLADPEGYFHRLAQCAPQAWIIAEKILMPSEQLPKEWPVAGTTGYDFLNRVNGLFVDKANESQFSRFYHEFTGRSLDYEETVRQKKHLVMEKSFYGDIDILVELLMEIRFRHRPYRDLIRPDLMAAVKESIACFPVYRSYTRPSLVEVLPRDRQYINTAISRASRHQHAVDQLAWELIENLLLMKMEGESESKFITRYQQLTGSVMAKGVEDTTFYCFNRLISLNEVGGDPGVFGSDLEEFHQHCAFIQSHYPLTLSATATHDTKRGEDTRLRINLLSEIPEKWSETVIHWSQMTQKYQTDGLPDANTLYFLYQTLVGTWPITLDRFGGYMQKAVREAKVNTSWTEPDKNFESILAEFMEQCFSDKTFVKDVEGFVSGLLQPAQISSLSQALIKCTAPGIPDIYQGTEFWDLSLVDPDNRRQVDFSQRHRMLEKLSRQPRLDNLPDLDSGLSKLFVIQSALAVRRDFPESFGEKSSYRPLKAKGRKANHAVAFARGESSITIVPRLLLGLDNDWMDTVIRLPRRIWINVFTREEWEGGDIELASLLKHFPVALLVSHHILP